MSALVFIGSLLALLALGLPIAFALMFAGIALMLLRVVKATISGSRSN